MLAGLKKGFTLIELLIVVAIIAILAAIAVPNFLEAQTRSKVSRVQSDQRSLSVAIESYYIDTNQYPAQASSFPSNKAFGINDLENAPSGAFGLRYQPTFIHKPEAKNKVFTLTTPISYITSFFSDPFASTKGGYFSYSRTGSYGQSWIMWSFGPDMDETQKLTFTGVTLAPGIVGDIAVIGGTTKDGQPGVETTFYSPLFRHPQPNLVIQTYDPTNGTTSNGDIYRVKD